MAILRTDPETRKKAFCLIGVITLMGMAVIYWGLPRFKAYIFTLPPGKAIQILGMVMSLLFLSLVPLALYLYRIGRKTLGSNQFPPPGTKVVRDTVVQTGHAARRRGLILIAGSVMIMVMALFAATYFPFKFNKSFKDRIIQGEKRGLSRQIDVVGGETANR